MRPKVPRSREMLQTILRAAESLGGSGSRSEIADRVMRDGGFSDEVLAVLTPDGKMPQIQYNVGWGLSSLKKIDALDNSSRGVWSLTPAGRALISASSESVKHLVDDAWKEAYASKNAGKNGASGEPGIEPDAEEKDDDELDWKSSLLSTLHGIAPDAFERLAQRILRESNFTKVDVLGKTGDGGLDGVGILRVALLSFHVYFQCKRYKPGNTISAGQIRDFRGALSGRGEKGLFITTASFTSDARKEATRDGVIPIDLIDGDALCELLRSLDLGVRKELVERVTVDPEWFRSI